MLAGGEALGRAGGTGRDGRAARRRPSRAPAGWSPTAEQRLPRVHGAHGADEVLGVGVLEHEAAGPAAQRPADVLVDVEVVTTSTRTSGWAAVISSVAVRPSPPGMRTSISTTSGRSDATARTAAGPSPASPTTSNPPVAVSTVRKPVRTIGWSSTSSTRMPTRASCQDARVTDPVSEQTTVLHADRPSDRPDPTHPASPSPSPARPAPSAPAWCRCWSTTPVSTASSGCPPPRQRLRCRPPRRAAPR